MTERKYQVGDVVKVCDKRPEKYKDCWNQDMDVYFGKVFRIIGIKDGFVMQHQYTLHNNSYPECCRTWVFDESWLTKLEPVEHLPAADDIHPFELIVCPVPPTDPIIPPDWVSAMEAYCGQKGIVTAASFNKFNGKTYELAKLRFGCTECDYWFDRSFLYYPPKEAEKPEVQPVPEAAAPVQSKPERLPQYPLGTRVKIIGPSPGNYTSDVHTWVPSMDSIVGKIGTISVVGTSTVGTNYYRLQDAKGVGLTWGFIHDWLTPVPEPVPEPVALQCYEIGTRVIVTAPPEDKKLCGAYHWISSMDKFNGKTMVITKAGTCGMTNYSYELSHNGTKQPSYRFLHEWLTPVKEEEANPVDQNIKTLLSELNKLKAILDAFPPLISKLTAEIAEASKPLRHS